VGTVVSVPADPVATARRLAEEVLFPAALATDVAPVLPVHLLDALAAAGMYGLVAPPDAGGLGAGPAEVRAVVEALAGGCLTTCFVWIQHLGVVATVGSAAPAALRAEWLVPLSRGERRAGVAFAHLRRPGPPVLRATTEPGGVRLHGTTPWITGWGRIHVVHVAARADDGSVVWCLVDAEAAGGLSVEPLQLAALQASATVRARFDAVLVPDGRVTLRESGAQWAARDAAGLTTNGALGLGVAARCASLLAGAHPAPASSLHDEVMARRAELAAAAPDALPAVRAAITELAWRASAALVVAGGGGAVSLESHAQRLAREALFLLVQGQTAAIRCEQLRQLAAPMP
jgi:alkylation response protein AidB-like acyl-CoA dehydrogenase